jgi:WD40 repeat protein
MVSFAGHTGLISSVTFAAADLVVSGGDDGSVRVWDVKNELERKILGRQYGGLYGHKNSVTSVSMSSDANIVVTSAGLPLGAQDNTARVWARERGEGLATLSGHGGPVSKAAITSDASRIVTASLDGSAGVWEPTGADKKDWHRVARLAGHANSLSSAAITPDGRRIVTLGLDGKILVWEQRKVAEELAWTSVTELKPDRETVLRSVAISADGRRLVTGHGANLVSANNSASVGAPSSALYVIEHWTEALDKALDCKIGANFRHLRDRHHNRMELVRLEKPHNQAGYLVLTNAKMRAHRSHLRGVARRKRLRTCRPLLSIVAGHMRKPSTIPSAKHGRLLDESGDVHSPWVSNARSEGRAPAISEARS